MSSPNVHWHAGHVARDDRADHLGVRGATLWLTGLSGSGKSTLAAAVEHRLVTGGRNAYRLDGDNLRTGLNGDLGFDRSGRDENTRRVAEVARLFADAGLVAVVALISPYADSRAAARRLHQQAGIPFVEIYLSAPVTLCVARDPKGLYAQASAGEINAFTGIGDPYEPPEAAELVVEAGTPLERAVDAALAALARAEAGAEAGAGAGAGAQTASPHS